MAKLPVPDVSGLTWFQLRDLIGMIWVELKRRNPIGINFYGAKIGSAFNALDEIAKAERLHKTAECGPRKDKKK